MFNKSMIALSVAIALGSVSTAFAYDDPENKIGDRYPFLEQKYPVQQRAAAVRSTVSGATVRYATFDQFTNEAPENRISDRYPFLEQATRPVATSARFAGPYLASRQARLTSLNNPYTYEAPENKIGDRYPFLEPVYRSAPGIATASGPRRSASRG